MTSGGWRGVADRTKATSGTAGAVLDALALAVVLTGKGEATTDAELGEATG